MHEIIHSIRFPFSIDGGLGRLREEIDYDAHIVQLIKQVLFTAPGERVNRPDFGCGLHRMVFEPNSELTAGMLELTINESLERWLGTVIVTSSIIVKAIEERLKVTVVYVVKVRQEKRILNLEVTL
jgi:phage baseplate assembly protein W